MTTTEAPFDPNAPLPPLNIRQARSWEPAAMSENKHFELADEDDEVFRAERFGDRLDDDAVIELSRFPQDGERPTRVVFYSKDAESIISIIREAAK